MMPKRDSTCQRIRGRFRFRFRFNCGTRILPTSLSCWWTEDRAKYGLDGWCLHEFRHTYLTLLAIQGVHPKVMQEFAGHYSSQISMDIYTHVNMDSKRQAVDIVSAVF